MSIHPSRNILTYIKQLNRPVFTTRELAALSHKTVSTATQSLSYLAREKLVMKVYRGVWVDPYDSRLSPYSLIPFLTGSHRTYVSFVSALHLHGIIEQIPQVMTLASTAHTKTIHTKLGVFKVHQLTPGFFKGFDWYQQGESFLIAEPEKALVDSFYLAVHKKRQYGHFPEMHFPPSFSMKKVIEWIEMIPGVKDRMAVKRKFEQLYQRKG